MFVRFLIAFLLFTVAFGIQTVQRGQRQILAVTQVQRVSQPDILIYALTTCGGCHELMDFLKEHHIVYTVKYINEDLNARDEYVKKGFHTVPQVFVDGKSIGGYEAAVAFVQSHHLGDL